MTISKLLPDNPVLLKDMRVRMRGTRAYWLMFAYLLFLSLVLLLSYFGWQRNASAYGGSSDSASMGTQLFMYVVATQAFFVLFLTPAITSGSITLEHEQRTLDMLTMTRLPRWNIIAGKLFSAVAFTSLLLLTSLPLVSVCFMLGGVDPAMVVSMFMMMLAGSFFAASLGLMWSALCKATTQAVFATYGSLFVIATLAAMFSGGYYNNYTYGGDVLVNIGIAIGHAWYGTRFLGIPGPEGIGFAITCVLSGVLLCAIAMSRLETWPERRGGLLRLLATGLIGLQLLAVHVWWTNKWYVNALNENTSGGAIHPLAALNLTVFVLMLLVPTYASGELTPHEILNFRQYLRSGWTRKGLSRSKLASGLPFLLLLTLFCLSLYLIGFVFTGNLKNIPQGYDNLTLGGFLGAGLVLTISVLGFASFNRLLNVIVGNRWISWMLGTLVMVLIWVLPAVALISPEKNGIPRTMNLFYLDPAQSVLDIVYRTPIFAVTNHGVGGAAQMLFGMTPAYVVTPILWGLMGLVSLVLTHKVVAMQARKLNKTPHAETVAAA